MRGIHSHLQRVQLNRGSFIVFFCYFVNPLVYLRPRLIEVSYLNRQALRGYENYVYQRKLGLFDDTEWEGVYATIEDHFSVAETQEDWRAYRHQYSAALRKHLDPLVPDLEDPSKRPPVTFTKPTAKEEKGA